MHKKLLILTFLILCGFAVFQRSQAASFTTTQNGDWNNNATWGSSSFSGPYGLTLDSSDNIYIADSNNNRIVKLDPSGALLNIFVSTTSPFSYPSTVVLDSTGNMYIANRNGDNVIKLNPSGTFIAKFTVGNSLSSPYGLGVDTSGNMYIADTGNDRVVKLDPSGAILNVFTAGNTLSAPFRVAVDALGNMFVTDNNNSRVVKLDPSGTILDTFDTGIPRGIVLDSLGDIYAAGNNMIVKFNASGTLLSTFTAGGTLSDPEALGLDSSGNLYVADSGNNRILKLDSSGTIIHAFNNFIAGIAYPGSSDTALVQNSATLTSDQSVSNLTIASGGSLDLNGHNLTISGNFINNGTLIAGAGTLSVSGNFTNNGTFSAGTGTVNLTGTDQTISGNTTFYNLTKTTISADTLFFTGGTQMVTGTLSLSGASGNLLTLRQPTSHAPQFSLKWGQLFNNSAFFGEAFSLVRDPSGDIYVADAGSNHILKLDSSGTILNTFTAGGSLTTPQGVAVDSSGNIYISDTVHDRIVKLDPSGNIVATFDPGNSLSDPTGITVDTLGNIYVVDAGNQRILKLDSSGTILDTFGSGNSISGPTDVALDSLGNIYVLNSGTLSVTRLSPSGTVLSTFDASSSLSNPIGLGLDNSGNMYVADTSNNVVIKLNASGTLLSTFTASSTLSSPTDVVLDSSGNMYVTDYNNQRIVKLDPTGTVIQIIPNNNPPNGAFEYPWGITTDSHGNVYISDCADGAVDRIQKFDENGNFILAFGTGGSDPGQFSCPVNLAVDAQDNIYVSDNGNNRSEKFDSSGNFLAQFGSGNQGSAENELDRPYGITVDPSGNVYVADNNNHRIDKFANNGSFVLTFGWGVQDGSSAFQICSSGCQAGISGSGIGQLTYPEDLVSDSQGNIYVPDQGNNRIEEFGSNGAFLEMYGWGVQDGISQFETCTSSCQEGIAGSGDGQFDEPYAMDIDSSGNIYIDDYDNFRIEVFDPSMNYLYQWGSNGTGDNQLDDPEDMTVNNQGDVYVVDSSIAKIKKFSPVSGWNISPSGTVSVSFLSVSGSDNLGPAIDCTNGCVNEGGNVNWTFPVVQSGGGGGVSDGGGGFYIPPTVTVNPITTNVPATPGLAFPGIASTNPSGPLTSFSSNTLVLDNGTIYLIANGTKIGFTSMKAFLGLGYKLKYVIKRDASSYSSSAFVYTSPTQVHAYGSWLSKAKTIYYSTSQGLIPISSMTVFTNNGGLAKYIVPMNTNDAKLPVLPVMRMGDERVTK